MSEFKNLVGKKILNVYVTGIQHPGKIVFKTDAGTYSYIACGDCCSTSWFEHVSGLVHLLNATINEVKEISMKEIPTAEQKDYDCLQNYGWRFVTDKGYFEIEMRNESNGYYGGYIEGPFTEENVKRYVELEEDF